MHRRSFARGARRWPAGSLAAALALLGAPAAFGSTPITADRSAGWHGREIRDPRPYDAATTSRGRPAGWSAGAVRLGSGYRRAGGSRRVREVQRRLRGRGYRPGRVDGLFGPRTRAALLWFQVKHGLRPHGAVDARTLAALRSRPSRLQRAATRVPAAPSPTVAAALPPAPAALSGTDTAALVVAALLLLGGLVAIGAWTRAALREAAKPTREGSPQRRSEGLGEPAAGRTDERRPAEPASGRVGEPRHRSGIWCEPPDGLVGQRRAAEPEPADPAAGRIQPPPPADPPARLVAVPPRRVEHVRHARPSRVLGYVTVLPGQPREFGLDPATEAIAAWCERHGWDLTRVIHDIESGAGRMADRPGLYYALDQIGEGAVAGIVLARMGDLAGSLPELGTRLRWLVEADAFLIALDYEIDTSTAAGDVAARALVEVGDWERARFTERSRRAPAKLGAAGRPAVRDDPELSARIAALRARGLSLQAIADTLNHERVPTVRGGAKWRPSSVQAATGYKRPPQCAHGNELPPIRRDPAAEREDRRA